MADDIRQNFGTPTAATITLDSLANGTSATSSAIDLGNPGPFGVNLECKINGASASNTDLVEIYAQWSDDNTDFDSEGNDHHVGVVDLNGTTAQSKTFRVPVTSRYVKIRAKNASGDALAASGSSITYTTVAVDQA